MKDKYKEDERKTIIRIGFSLLKNIQGNDVFFKQRATRWFGSRCSISPSWVDSTCFGLHALSKQPSLCFGDYCVFIQIHHHKELMKSIECHGT
jgi:hypothetical protein